jgi:hypothetical protein
MSTVQESVAVTSAGDVLVIKHQRTFDDGHVMADTLVIAPSSARWLADHVVKAFAEHSSPYALEAAPDALDVEIGGPDYEPCVNILNTRDASAARPGLSGMSGLREAAASELATKLRAIQTTVDGLR